MGKNEKNLITINEKEYNVDELTQEQMIALNHINDLGRKLDNARFNVDLSLIHISEPTRPY